MLKHSNTEELKVRKEENLLNPPPPPPPKGSVLQSPLKIKNLTILILSVISSVKEKVKFDKCKDVFRKDLTDIPEEKRVRLLPRLLVTAEHKKLKSHIRQKELADLKFDEAVFNLCESFGEKSLEFRKCFKCLTLNKGPYEN
ncbi:hypothetical protein ACTXT7_011054 [Hymenolepis weldensis]